MTLSKLERKNIDIINNVLQKEHGFTVTLDESIPNHKLKRIRSEFMNEQKEISFTESAQNNPEYSQCALVIEATNILLGEGKQSYTLFGESNTRVSEIQKLEELLETIKEKQPKKAKKLEERIDVLRDKVYSESKHEELTRLLKEDAQQAEVIMAGKNLFDTVQGFQTKIGDLMNKNLDPFIDRVRSVYGAEVADKMYSSMEDTLTQLMSQTRESKDVFYKAVGVLTGEGGDLDDSVDGSEVGAEPSLDDDDLDLSDDVLDDAETEEESGEDDADDFDFDVDDEDFQRKEE